MQFVFSTFSESRIQSSDGGNEMMRAIEFVGDRDQFITGRPGSGKTTVTVIRAARLTRMGKRVLVLTKHKMLVYNLRKAYPTINIYWIDSWFKQKTGAKLWEISDPEEVKKLMAEHNLCNDYNQYDELLIDEGQDLGSYIYQSIPAVGKRLLVGADTAQRIYKTGTDAADIEQILSDQGRDMRGTELQYNYRNYVETYDFARQFVPEMAAAHSKLILKYTKSAGDLPLLIQVADEFDRLLVILQDNSSVNVAIVLFYVWETEYYHRELTSRGVECSLYHHDLDEVAERAVASNLKNVLITTYHSVKGLEFPVVILPAMEKARTNPHQLENFYYVGCTRAIEKLYLLYQGNDIPVCLKDFDRATYKHILLSDSMSSILTARPTFDNDAPF